MYNKANLTIVNGVPYSWDANGNLLDVTRQESGVYIDIVHKIKIRCYIKK